MSSTASPDSLPLGSSPRAAGLRVIETQLASATAAAKCWTCGCFHHTIDGLARTELRDELAPTLHAANAVVKPRTYDCLGCAVCYPALATNAFAEAFPAAAASFAACPMADVAARPGWPPLPGDFRVVRYEAPVAVCTLNSADLADRLALASPEGLAIAGTLHTENLGIERVVRNTLANPSIRFLVVCGMDTRQSVGHLPGQSLCSLFMNGVDELLRIVGAAGKRPVLKNLARAEIDAFRRQVELVDLVDEESMTTIVSAIAACAARDPGTFPEAPVTARVDVLAAQPPERLTLDAAGYFVLFTDPSRRRLIAEHFRNDGLLDCVIAGDSPAAIGAAAIERGLVSRLDHAVYLGQELARAESALRTGARYVQDRAAGTVEMTSSTSDARSSSCGCSGSCGKDEVP